LDRGLIAKMSGKSLSNRKYRRLARVSESGHLHSSWGLLGFLAMALSCYASWLLVTHAWLSAVQVAFLVGLVVLAQVIVGGPRKMNSVLITLDHTHRKMLFENAPWKIQELSRASVKRWLRVSGSTQLVLQLDTHVVVIDAPTPDVADDMQTLLGLDDHNYGNIVWKQPESGWKTDLTLFVSYLMLSPIVWCITLAVALAPIGIIFAFKLFAFGLLSIIFAIVSIAFAAAVIWYSLRWQLNLIWKWNWTEKPWLRLYGHYMLWGENSVPIRYRDIELVNPQENEWNVTFASRIGIPALTSLTGYTLAGKEACGCGLAALEHLVSHAKSELGERTRVPVLPELEGVLRQMNIQDDPHWWDKLQKMNTKQLADPQYRGNSLLESTFWTWLRDPEALPNECTLAAYCLLRQNPKHRDTIIDYCANLQDKVARQGVSEVLYHMELQKKQQESTRQNLTTINLIVKKIYLQNPIATIHIIPRIVKA
jgi:hypothetical protein